MKEVTLATLLAVGAVGTVGVVIVGCASSPAAKKAGKLSIEAPCTMRPVEQKAKVDPASEFLDLDTCKTANKKKDAPLSRPAP